MDQVFHIGGVLRSGFLLFLIGTLIGYPVSIYFDSLTRHRLLLAPALGLSLWGAITLPIFFAIKFSYFNIVIFALIIVLAFNAVNWRYMGQKPEYKLEALFKNSETSRLGYMWVVFAALLSLFPALAAAPHFFGGGVGFGAPIFDHEKVALIDEIVRTGMPARNPFFQMVGTSHLLNYYYGWYFLAAQAAMLAGASGWETDIGFTFVTAFASLAFMAWAAVSYSGKRNAGWWVLAISLVSSILPVVNFVFGPFFGNFIVNEHGLETWIIQSSWVPQHLFSATAACLAIFGLVRLLGSERLDVFLCFVVGILAGFSYDSSIWVGVTGLVPVLMLISCVTLRRGNLQAALLKLAITGGVGLAVVMVVAVQEFQRLHGGSIIALWFFPVLTRSMHFRSDVENFVSYWLILLTLYFGFAYVVTSAWAFQRLCRFREMSLLDKAMMISFLTPLLVAEMLHSIIANNDLAWRVVLISILMMTILASAVMAELQAHISERRFAGMAVAISVFLVPGILSGLGFMVGTTSEQWLYGGGNADNTQFLKDKQMWRAVDLTTPSDEAVASNPLYLQSLTPWPGNISWAMLSNRDTCTPPFAYLAAFAPQADKAELGSIYDFMLKIFNGAPQAADFQTLRDRFLCKTILVVPSDALWTSKVLAASGYYHQVEDNPGKWTIYRAN